MLQNYGTSRVLEPKFVVPTSAWRLDNSRSIRPDEVRVSIRKIHLEGTSFKQICTESSNNPDKIRQTIIDIVIRRGKLHNPVTDTGGLLYGVVEAIGEDYANKANLTIGSHVICNASITSFPMHLENIGEIDWVFNQVEATGYAIMHSDISMIKVDEDTPVRELLFALDESGTLFKLSKLLSDQRRFLIVGNNILSNILYGYVIRRELGDGCEITCVLDKRTGLTVTGDGVEKLISQVFDQVQLLDILRPIECIKQLGESSYDLSVNCAEIPGAETVNILATRENGTVLFANLINNLNIALYITEAISKSLEVIGADGYSEGYERFDMEIINEIAEDLGTAEPIAEDDGSTYEGTAETYSRFMTNSMYEDFICDSKQMQKVLQDILKVSRYDCNVIIFGDTGVGKEKAANLIQKNSDRKMQPFLKINCGAISPNLIESEFFGYERGAFTGASSSGKKGYFEIANNGVLFLDEIGELPLEMQAKLLRVIQDGEFYRVGGISPIKSNVRIISATNRNLEKMVEEGNFRRDLYYRLNVVPIIIPRLSDRREDIPGLVEHFLRKYGDKFSTKKTISPWAMDYLKEQPWEGNIRELENVIQRMIISSRGREITLADVMAEIKGSGQGDDAMAFDAASAEESEINLEMAVNEYERGLIRYAMEKYGSTRKAAKAVGISQSQLVRKKKKYNI
ncbi:MAG: sigma 54-interacting transcriptional regulator [Firmicutes bacterium]|nr:sigma 54-interacting transcriptional regulator [Bacillota bacterium]